MTALRAYRSLPATAGVWFLMVGLLGRLPAAMLQIGTLLLVAAETGSLAAGGAAAAALALGQALGGPLVGRLADARGHRVVGLTTSVAQVVTIVALVLTSSSGAPLPAVLCAAVGTGLSIPQVGALARARWAGMLPGQREVFGTAMSYEGAVDETTYVLGPTLVGLVAAVASPAAAMLVAAALTAVFATGFALHPSAHRVGHDAHLEPAGGQRADLRSLWLLTALMFCTGMFFASMQAGVTATAVAAGSEAAAGLVYGAMGLTSAIAGLLTPALPARFSLPARLVVFPVVLLVCLAPVLLLSWTGPMGLPALVLCILLVGAAVAPTLITGISLGERTVPLARMSWAMTVLASGIVLGYGTAALLAGSTAQAYGPIGAFAVTAGAVVGAVLFAVVARPRLTRLPGLGQGAPAPAAPMA